MKKLILIAMMMLGYCGSVLAEEAIHFEAMIGASQYQKKNDGYWYQEGFPHKLDLNSTAGSIGVTGNLWNYSKFGIDWHADWVWLGTVHTQSYAVGDANYNVVTRGCNGSCGEEANYVGSGHDQGVALTIEPYYKLNNNWRVGIEGGLYIHRPLFSEVITPNNPSESPLYLQNENDWVRGNVIGASVEYKDFRVSYRYFTNNGVHNDQASTIWKKTGLVTIGWRF